MESMWEALQYNRDFFKRQGGYRYMMLIESPSGSQLDLNGGQGDEALIKKINYEVTEVRKDSRTDLLAIPLGKRTARLERLDGDLKDLDFPSLLSMYRDDVRVMHGVPPLKAGIVESGALGGNVGQEQLRSYRDSVVTPKQRKWNALVNEVIRVWWGIEAGFAFTPLEIDEVALLSPHAERLFRSELLTRAEARKMLGYEDIDDGQPTWAGELGLTGGMPAGPEGKA
jgi:hypothetical protein